MVPSKPRPTHSPSGVPIETSAATWHSATYVATAKDAIASAQRRERLLAASAAASRLLLQAPDVMADVPKVLQLVGEAADADRVRLLLRQPNSGEGDQLVVAAEWCAPSR